MLGIGAAALMMLMNSGGAGMHVEVTGASGPNPVVSVESGSADLRLERGEAGTVRLLDSDGNTCADSHDGTAANPVYACDNSSNYGPAVPRGATLKIDGGSGDLDVRQ